MSPESSNKPCAGFKETSKEVEDDMEGRNRAAECMSCMLCQGKCLLAMSGSPLDNVLV